MVNIFKLITDDEISGKDLLQKLKDKEVDVKHLKNDEDQTPFEYAIALKKYHKASVIFRYDPSINVEQFSEKDVHAVSEYFFQANQQLDEAEKEQLNKRVEYCLLRARRKTVELLIACGADCLVPSELRNNQPWQRDYRLNMKAIPRVSELMIEYSKLDEAEKILERLANDENREDDPDVNNALGLLSEVTRDYNNATLCFEAAHDAAKEDLCCQNNHMTILIKIGDVRKALKEVGCVILAIADHDTDENKIQKIVRARLLGDAFYNLGMLERAIVTYRTALEMINTHQVLLKENKNITSQLKACYEKPPFTNAEQSQCVSWRDDLDLFYGAKNPRKFVEIPGTAIHNQLFRYATIKSVSIPENVNIVIARLTFIVSDSAHEAAGQHQRKTISFPLKVPDYKDCDVKTFWDSAGLTWKNGSKTCVRNSQFRENVCKRMTAGTRAFIPSNWQVRANQLQAHICEHWSNSSSQNFDNNYRHSEQALYEHMNDPETCAYVVAQLDTKIKESKNVKVYGVVLDMFSTREMCSECAMSTLGMQQPATKMFLNRLETALVNSGFKIPQKKKGESVLHMVTRVSALTPHKGTISAGDRIKYFTGSYQSESRPFDMRLFENTKILQRRNSEELFDDPPSFFYSGTTRGDHRHLEGQSPKKLGA